MNSKVHQLTEITKSDFQKNIFIAKFPIFLVAVTLLFLCSMCIPTSADSVDNESKVKITYPSNGSLVEIDEIVTGTAENVPEGQHLWILVYPLTANKFYPQHGNVSVINGMWSLNVGLGDKQNVNETFKIIAVLADQESNEELTNYITTGNSTNWPGMESVPDGAKVVDEVTVTRLNSEIKITYPSNGSLVEIDEIVTGTAENIPEGQSLWIIVYPLTANKFYPQHGNVSVINGIWSINVGLGDKENVNETFKIIAALADQESNEELTNYITTGNSTGNWPGIGSIPNGAKVFDEVAVTRVGEEESSSSGGSSHSSSGGGGGGGGSPEPQKNVEFKDTTKAFILNEKPICFNFTNNVTVVESISFESKKTMGMTTAIVENLKNKSALVSGLPPEPASEVYKSFNVWVGNDGYGYSDNMQNASICFKVNNTWIRERDINQSSIVLNKYDKQNKEWTRCPVTLACEDKDCLYFTANIPGFYSFSITGISKVGSESVNRDENNSEEPTPTETVTETGQTPEEESSLKSSWKFIGVTVVILISMVLIYLLIKHLKK